MPDRRTSGAAHDEREEEQVRYIDDLMPVFDEEGVDSVFRFSFFAGRSPHRTQGGPDLDMASYSIVKLLDEKHGIPSSARAYPDLPWEPKEAFHALAGRYAALG
ncbi:hypothetical protein ACIP3U_16155 [[Kitasatospora] papulosa]|uniref:hypothetical protein n=1 Tax=[Kitasatospora] papulosa TaxID=1464011 RepID=UPI0026B0BAD3